MMTLQDFVLRLKQRTNRNAFIYLLSFLFLASQACSFLLDNPLNFIFLGCCSIIVALILFKKNLLYFIFFSLNILGFVLPISSIVHTFLIIGLLILLLLMFSPLKQRIQNALTDLPFLGLYCLGILLSILWSATQGSITLVNQYFSFNFALYFCFFFFLQFILTPQTFRSYINAYLASSLIFLAILYSLASFMPWNSPDRLSVAGLLHPNLISIFLELFFPIALFRAFESKSLKHQLLFFLIALIQIITILWTYSRGGLFTILGCLAYLALKRITLRKVIIMTLLAIAFTPIFFKGFYARSSAKSMDQLVSAGTRIELQRTALQMSFKNYLIFGYGLNEFYKIKYQAGFPTFLDPDKAMSSHSSYLEILLGVGLFGFIGFYGLIFFSLYGLIRVKTKDHNDIRLGLIFCIISFLLHSFLDSGLPIGSFSISVFAIMAFSRFFIRNINEIENNDKFTKGIIT